MKCCTGWSASGIKIAGRNINNIRYADDITLMTESENKLKSLLMKVKEESEKAGLKLNIQKMSIMTSASITSCRIDGETMKTGTDIIFLGSKITVDGVCYSHEIKRHLLLGRKTLRSLESILKSRDITLPTKICIVKAMVFPVVLYGCESWTKKKKKAERQRIDAFKLWCWRRLENPLECEEIKSVNPKGNNPEYSLVGLMLKLKLQYFAIWCKELTHWKRPWCLKRLKVGGERKMRCLDDITNLMVWVWANSRRWWGQGSLVCCSIGSQRVKHNWVTKLSWTEDWNYGWETEEK